MKNNAAGPTQVDLFKTLIDMNNNKVSFDRKFFNMQTLTENFYGKDRKITIFKPHL
jgi:hypothetical protein